MKKISYKGRIDIHKNKRKYVNTRLILMKIIFDFLNKINREIDDGKIFSEVISANQSISSINEAIFRGTPISRMPMQIILNKDTIEYKAKEIGDNVKDSLYFEDPHFASNIKIIGKWIRLIDLYKLLENNIEKREIILDRIMEIIHLTSFQSMITTAR